MPSALFHFLNRHPFTVAIRLLLCAALFTSVGTDVFGQNFMPTAVYPVGANPQGVALADVNGDGLADLVVTCSYANSVNVLLSQPGAGAGLAPAVSYSIGSFPIHVVVADVNNDGHPDILAALQYGGGVAIMRNSATNPGTFLPPTLHYTSGDPRSLAVGDINGDGQPDLTALNKSNGEVAVLLNSATAPGTFSTPATLYPTGGSSAVGIALADLNGDGRLDVVANGGATGRVGVLLNQASAPGTFAPVITYNCGGHYPQDLAVGDLNADGYPDIVVATGAEIGVLLNWAAAPGAFLSAVTYATGARGPFTVVLGDVTGDGRPDIISGNRSIMNSTTSIGVLVNSATAPGTFPSAIVEFPTGGDSPHDVAVGDADGNGRLDIATVNYASSTAAVLLNSGTYLATTAAYHLRVQVHPNPVHDHFTVVLPDVANPGKVLLTIVNSVGQQVRQLQVSVPQGSPSLTIPATSLPPGVYMLHVLAPGYSTATRLVVE